MKIYVCNAFSLSMLNRTAQSQCPRTLFPQTCDPAQWLNDKEALCADVGAPFKLISAVGHPDTARVFSVALRRPIEHNRITVRIGQFSSGEYLLIGQLVRDDGSPYRLPKGCTELPEDAYIEWWVV